MEYRYINTEYLEMVTGGDKAVASELIGIFANQVVEFGEKMRILNVSRSFIELGQLAHKAKSSVSIMGMEKLAELLKELELDCHTGINNEKYHGIIETFCSETEGSVLELEDYLAKL